MLNRAGGPVLITPHPTQVDPEQPVALLQSGRSQRLYIARQSKIVPELVRLTGSIRWVIASQRRWARRKTAGSPSNDRSIDRAFGKTQSEVPASLYALMSNDLAWPRSRAAGSSCPLTYATVPYWQDCYLASGLVGASA